MLQYVPLILASGLLAFLVTPVTRILARRVGMIDQPGLRKAHRSPIPLMGGLAIFTAFILSFLFFGFEEWLNKGLGIVGGGQRREDQLHVDPHGCLGWVLWLYAPAAFGAARCMQLQRSRIR